MNNGTHDDAPVSI